MRTIRTLLSLFLLALVAGAGFIWTGAYPIGADVPHWPLVYNLLEITRQRSIALRAKDIRVPALDDPKLIAEGGEHYGAMCSGCHLAPGMTDSEIRQGLYPQPPDLTKSRPASAAEEFWAIKHGIKLSAMPAWGTTHDDQAIWGLVAFLQKLPGMTPEQYQTLAGSGASGAHTHHHHGDADHDDHEHAEHGNDEHATMPAGDAHHDESDHHPEHAAAPSEEHHHEAATKNTPISMEGLSPGAVPATEAPCTRVCSGARNRRSALSASIYQAYEQPLARTIIAEARRGDSFGDHSSSSGSRYSLGR